MSATRTYLDYNATAPLRPEARQAMCRALDLVGNPSSVHAEGRAARGVIEAARDQVAALVGAKPSEVVFTSGATEANAWVMAAGWARIHVASQEHPSVLEPARRSGATVIELASLGTGVADLSTLDIADLPDRATGRGAGGRELLSLQLANGETGVIQPLAEAVRRVAGRGRIHCDATQAAGRIGVDFAALGIDFLSLSAHKLGGPKGIGALIVRDGADLAPLLPGGGQERRRRAGTENVAAIAGFGAAAAAAARDLDGMATLAALRDRLERELIRITPEAVVIGQGSARLANTSCLALKGRSADMLVIRLDLAGIAVSAGSACSSGKVGSSHVLAAMGLEADVQRGAIRVSLGGDTTAADIDAFLAAWLRIADASKGLRDERNDITEHRFGAPGAPVQNRLRAGER